MSLLHPGPDHEMPPALTKPEVEVKIILVLYIGCVQISYGKVYTLNFLIPLLVELNIFHINMFMTVQHVSDPVLSSMGQHTVMSYEFLKRKGSKNYTQFLCFLML